VQPLPDGVLLAVIDGLGHGEGAAAAARSAAAVLRQRAREPLVPLVQHCHEALRRTSGAVMSLAVFQPGEGVLTWLGVGNVEGIRLRADAGPRPARDAVVQRGGVVGYRLPPLRASVLSVAPGDTLILATDGIRSGFAERLDPSGPPQQIADDIFHRYAKDTDDALVLVARLGATTA
jgi:hypothetical protein